MKITAIETFVVDAGWRPWQYVAVRTNEGITGYGEMSDGRNPYGIVGAVTDFFPILKGQDPLAVEKRYWALVQGKAPERGHLVNYLARRQSKSRGVDDKTRAQLAELSFERLVYADGVSWVSVDLATGRHHQIRVQFAHIGHALLGDFKYGSRKPFPKRSLALHARSLTLLHPTKKELMTFEAEPEAFWPEQFT